MNFNKNVLIIVLTALFCGSLFAQNQENDIVGVWQGEYLGTGKTTLSVNRNMTGVFDFTNQNQSGSYKVFVTYENKKYNVTGTEWINQPDGFVFWNFSGTIDDGVFSGTGFKFKNSVTINGVTWALSNVDSVGFFAETRESAGMLYQWNKNVAWDNISEIVEDWDTIPAKGKTWAKENDPSPKGWRVPNKEELLSLLDTIKVEQKWTTLNGVSGIMFFDKISKDSIFFPAVGYRNKTNKLRLVGKYSYYWSATEQTQDGNYNYASCLTATEGMSGKTFVIGKAPALPVRPVEIEDEVWWRRCACPECVNGVPDMSTLRGRRMCKDCPECPPNTIMTDTIRGVFIEENPPMQPPTDGGTTQLTGRDTIPPTGGGTPPPTNTNTPCDESDGVIIANIMWAKRNVGTSGSFVKKPEEAGEFFKGDKAKNACPNGWRLPTQDEFEVLINTNGVWTTQNGVNGYRFTENGCVMFLPATGLKASPTGPVVLENQQAYYWSGTHYNVDNAYYLKMSAHNIQATGTSNLSLHCSVRCVADSKKTPKGEQPVQPATPTDPPVLKKNACEEMEKLIRQNTTAAKLEEGIYVTDMVCVNIDGRSFTFNMDGIDNSFTVENNGLPEATASEIKDYTAKVKSSMEKITVKFENGIYYNNAWTPNLTRIGTYKQDGDLITITVDDKKGENLPFYYRASTLWQYEPDKTAGAVIIYKKIE